jgi:aspartyl-tRNA(Asn)/glutamyl-tRNA(Gln) amidotransferase subunit C
MNIDESEINDVEGKLSKIIAFVDQLQAVSTENIEPMAHPLNQSQRLRTDKVTEIDDRENVQKNAQEIEKGMYIVPKVIE